MERLERNSPFVYRRLLSRTLGVMGIAAYVLLIAGCGPVAEPDKGAHQSLVEIGEHSLEEAERLEMNGRKGEANAAYQRSLWAFRYHEHLTGEEPLLLDEAVEGIERTGGRRKKR